MAKGKGTTPLEHVCHVCFSDYGWEKINNTLNTYNKRNLYDGIHQAIIDVAVEHDSSVLGKKPNEIIALVADRAREVKARMDRLDMKAGMSAGRGRLRSAGFHSRLSVEKDAGVASMEIDRVSEEYGLRVTEEEYERINEPDVIEETEESIKALMEALDTFIPNAHEAAIGIIKRNPDTDFLGGIASALSREMGIHRRTAQRRVAAFREYCLTNCEARSALRAVLGI
jgi:hypothetical protein